MAKVSEVAVGSKYGRWTVTRLEKVERRRRSGRSGRETVAWCRCECGSEGQVSVCALGTTSKSCGCLHRELVSSHRVSATKYRLYQIWHAMVKRCSNQKSAAYKSYGAKGVTVCQEWLDVVQFVAWAEANGYADDLSIDRIDPFGNYEPNNCRWVTMDKQAGNRRRKQMYTAWGETKSASDWLADPRCNVGSRRLLRHRVHIEGWGHERALATPKQTDPTSYVRRGEECTQAKLSNSQVDEVRAALTRGETCTAIAQQFGVSLSLISAIKLGKVRV